MSAPRAERRAAPSRPAACRETRQALVASKPAQAGLEPRHSLPSGDRPTYPSDEGPSRQVLALSGGVGGAKLALGLARVLDPAALTVVANTGDDFEHLGLAISPDIDTLLYTLSGLADPERGWGRRDESWHFMAALEQLGGADWFALGDADLALHVQRSLRLAQGDGLDAITGDFGRALGIAARIVPMCNERVRTRVRSDDGWLDFQDYFVRLRCAPVVRELAYDGAAAARPCGPLLQMARDDGSLRAVVLCPSNPYLSIDPILALPGVRDALAACRAPVVAVSPIVGGDAVKGPTAKLMRELGLAVGHAAIARHYAGLIDALVVDADEPGLREACGGDIEIVVAPTLMRSLGDRERLAAVVLEHADRSATRRTVREEAA